MRNACSSLLIVVVLLGQLEADVFEDFELGVPWSFIVFDGNGPQSEDGDWAVEDGVYRQRNSNLAAGGDNSDLLGTYALADPRFSSFEAQLDFRLDDTNDLADAALVFGYQDNANYYFVLFNTTSESNELFVVTDGVRTALGAPFGDALSDSGIVVADAAFHTARLVRTVETGQILLEVDGFEVLNVTDDTYLSGKFGVGSLNDAASFDNIQIRSPQTKSYGFDFEFGTCHSCDGEFLFPTGVTVDSLDRIIVADTGNDRIQVFDSTGEFLFKFGTLGAGPGDFDAPEAVASDRQGRIIVADTGNDRIQLFDSSGNFLSAFGTTGSGEGQFRGPHGIAVDSTGGIIVVDSSLERIQVFDRFGGYLFQFDSAFSGACSGGSFLRQSVAIDSSDRIIVAGLSSDVRVFDSLGMLQFRFGQLEIGELGCRTVVAVDSSDRIVVSHWTEFDGSAPESSIQVFDPQGEPLFSYGGPGDEVGEFDSPGGIAIERLDGIVVADSGNDRIQVFDDSGDFGFDFGTGDDADFRFAQDVAVDSGGRIIVLSPPRIRIFNSSGDFLRSFELFGDEGFSFAGAITVDSSDRILVALEIDDGNTQFAGIRFFDCDGEALADLEIGVFLSLAVGDDGRIVTLDLFGGIEVFDPTGKSILEFGHPGVSDGEFRFPRSVAVDSSGRIIVADSGNNRIQVFDSTGNFLFRFGTRNGPPESLAVDSENRIIVGFRGLAEVFDASGNFLSRLEIPSQSSSILAVDREDRIVVSDHGDRIHIYAPDRPPTESFAAVSVKYIRDFEGQRPRGLYGDEAQIRLAISEANDVLFRSNATWRLLLTEVQEVFGAGEYYNLGTSSNLRELEEVATDSAESKSRFRWRDEAINIYIVNLLTAGGVSHLPSMEHEIIGIDSHGLLNAGVGWLHEIGHYLGLLHTFDCGDPSCEKDVCSGEGAEHAEPVGRVECPDVCPHDLNVMSYEVIDPRDAILTPCQLEQMAYELFEPGGTRSHVLAAVDSSGETPNQPTPPTTKFLRGDSNNDGEVTISDAIHTLFAWADGTALELSCPDSADADDNGLIEPLDAVVTLFYLFLGQESLPGGETCASDQRDDFLPPCDYSADNCPLRAFSFLPGSGEEF